jgi:hypothetical protein
LRTIGFNDINHIQRISQSALILCKADFKHYDSPPPPLPPRHAIEPTSEECPILCSSIIDCLYSPFGGTAYATIHGLLFTCSASVRSWDTFPCSSEWYSICKAYSLYTNYCMHAYADAYTATQFRGHFALWAEHYFISEGMVTWGRACPASACLMHACGLPQQLHLFPYVQRWHDRPSCPSICLPIFQCDSTFP